MLRLLAPAHCLSSWCACIHVVCMYGWHMCLLVWVCAHVCAERPEVDGKCHSWSLSTLNF